MTAGGPYHGKVDPKKINLFGSNKSNEILSDSQANSAPKKFSLSGILGLNQTVEINKPPKSENWGKEFFDNINTLQQQETSLSNQYQKEQEKNIVELQAEIRNLTQSTENINNNDIQSIPLEYISEASEYQINFLERIKKYVAKNINEANNWLESFSQKKKKKNYFWSTAKNKKQGGEQYLMSSEHSASRSVN